MPLPPLSVRVASRCAAALWRSRGLAWAQEEGRSFGEVPPPPDLRPEQWQRSGLQSAENGEWLLHLESPAMIPGRICVLSLASDQRTIQGAHWLDLRREDELSGRPRWTSRVMTAREVGKALLADPDRDTRELGLRLLAPLQTNEAAGSPVARVDMTATPSAKPPR